MEIGGETVGTLEEGVDEEGVGVISPLAFL
jgi:hypothetical protein